jgi:hypothetical protein
MSSAVAIARVIPEDRAPVDGSWVTGVIDPGEGNVVGTAGNESTAVVDVVPTVVVGPPEPTSVVVVTGTVVVVTGTVVVVTGTEVVVTGTVVVVTGTVVVVTGTVVVVTGTVVVVVVVALPSILHRCASVALTP